MENLVPSPFPSTWGSWERPQLLSVEQPTPRKSNRQILGFWAPNWGDSCRQQGEGSLKEEQRLISLLLAFLLNSRIYLQVAGKHHSHPEVLAVSQGQALRNVIFNLQNSPLNPAVRHGLAVVWGWTKLGLYQRQRSCSKESGIFPSDRTGVFFPRDLRAKSI